jgi:hypothetical protein
MFTLFSNEKTIWPTPPNEGILILKVEKRVRTFHTVPYKSKVKIINFSILNIRSADRQ